MAEPAPSQSGAGRGAAASDPVSETKELAEFRQLMTIEEGRRNVVYRDSLGLPTVGIGHLVGSADDLKVGDRVTDARVEALFHEDGRRALAAARIQAAQAGIAEPDFLSRLAAVNFQLGAKWPRAFPRTWGMILAGDYVGAAEELEDSRWARQTPARVRAFQTALRQLAEREPERELERRTGRTAT